MTTVREPLEQFEQQVGAMLERELDERFATDRVSGLCEDFLERGMGVDLKELAGTRRFVVAAIPATSELSDIGRSVETKTFANVFARTLTDVYEDYCEYDDASVFIVVIDKEHLQPAGSIRIICPNDTVGLKSINDLVGDKPDNPWVDEIKRDFFEGEKGTEEYDPQKAWDRLCASAGVSIKPSETFDVATIAVDPGYSTNGSMDGTSLALYHSCLRFALGNGIKNLMSIQDIKPFEILQSFGKPFDVFPSIEPHPYGGPYDTVPAYCVLDRGMRNIRGANEFVGRVFIDGHTLGKNYLLLSDYLPEQFSNESIKLPPAE